MEQGKRNLDVTTSSMDVMALNNLVVSMRSAVKQSRVQIINKLTQQIRRYRKKKGSKEQVAKFQKKADRLKSEIDALKHVKIDHAAKSALACNISFEDAAKEGNIERRAIARLASHKLLQPKVDRFRKEHDDWKSLAAFMLSKNTGRRFKKKKTKKTPTNDAVSTGTAKVNEKQAPCTEIDAEMSDRSELAESETEQGDEQEDSDSPDEGSVSLKAQLSEPECYSPSITRDDQCPQSDDSPDDHSTNQYVTTTILQSKSECPKAVSKSVTPKTFRTKPKDSAQPASTIPHRTGTAPPPAFTELDVLKEKKSAMKSKLKSNTDEKTTRKTNLTQKPSEMVVQTLNLDEFNSESDIVVKPDFNVAKAEDLSFLYTAAEGNEPCTKKPRKKMKDPFFVGESGSEEEEETSSEDAGSEGTSGKTETQSLGRKISKNMVQSSFIDTLSRASSSRIREKHVSSRQVQEAKHQRPKMGGKPFPHPIQKVGERKRLPGKSTPQQSHDNTKGRTLQSGGATTAGGHITEKEPETKLHPSWEASKKRKQQVAGVKAFCGKKIKFDDDS